MSVSHVSIGLNSVMSPSSQERVRTFEPRRRTWVEAGEGSGCAETSGAGVVDEPVSAVG